MDPKKYTVPDAGFAASSDPNTNPVFSLPTLSQLEAMLKAQLEQDKAEEEEKARATAPVHSDSPDLARGEDMRPKSAPVPDLPTVEQLVRLQEENVPIRDPATERRAAPLAGARLSRPAPAKANVRVRPVRRAVVKVIPKQNKPDVPRPPKARNTDTVRTSDAVLPSDAPKAQPKDGLPTLAQLEAFLRSEKSAEEFSGRRPQSSAAVAARFRPEPREDVIPELISREDRFSSGLPTLSQLTDLLREEPKEPPIAPPREPVPARKPAEPAKPEKQSLPTTEQLAALLEQERAYGNTAFQESIRRARQNATAPEPEEEEPVSQKEKVCYIPYETFAAAYHPDFSDPAPEPEKEAAPASVFEEIPEPESLRPEEFDFTEEPDEGKRRGGKKRSADAHGSDAVRRYNTTMTVKLTVPPSWTSSLRKSS